MDSELSALKSATSDSTSTIATLQARISSLESSNQDTLYLLENKSTAYDKLTNDLSSQHRQTLDVRAEVSSLEQKIQSVQAVASTAKYHEQNLEQEIEQLKRNNDWLDRELKAKSDEHSKFRREKGARISELQLQNDEATNSLDAMRRTEQSLRKRIEDLSEKIEEYLSRIQLTSEEATRAEESHNKSTEYKDRLLEISRNKEAEDTKRCNDLADELESTKENAQDEISRLTAEIESESSGREAAERSIADLEAYVQKLEAEIAQRRTQNEEQSLHDGINGHPATPSRANSPNPSIFSPNRARVKGGLSMTQLYSENNQLKIQLATMKQDNERLSTSVDEMLQDAESMRPEIEEVRAEKTQLESSVAEMSSLVDQIGKEREQAVKSARKANGQMEAKTREAEVLRRQLRDLSAQIKILLFELDRRDKGLDHFNSDQQLQLEQLARSDPDSGDTDTDRFIAAELVMFKGIAELQEQNAKLLKLTRELGSRMEEEEAARKASDSAKDPTDYKHLYEQCQDEVRSLLTQSRSYLRERDLFRRLLTQRGQLPQDDDGNSTFSDSVLGGVQPTTPSQARLANSIEQSPHSKDLADHARLLKELTVSFDNYKHEAKTDHDTFRNQVDKLSNENNALKAEVARSNSQVALAHERYQMLQGNYTMLKTENGELQKRSQFFSDNAAKLELRMQQAAEDLIEAKGLLISLRNENANLRAEKEFFKTIEKRLTAENEAQFNEKARLNNLNINLQNLVNEREHSEGDTRRRLQTQVEALEKELEIAKRSLAEQLEEQKRIIDRRDFDHHQSQARIDDLLTSNSTAREELAGTKTSRDHLQSRVDELSIALRSAEERIQLLQPSPSARADASGTGSSSQINGAENGNAVNKEQDLAVEVSELKRDLELTRAELDNAKDQVDQYKSISQASEEELQSLNETQELYRQEMDQSLEAKNHQIHELEQRIKEIHTELTSRDTELMELRTKENETDRKLQEQKSTFEAEIAVLKDQDDRHATQVKYHQEDLKAQADIAQQAQQNYEDELVKHAEAAKALQKVRNDYNDLKIQALGLKTEADSARASLSQSEDSWLDSKNRYEQELKDLKGGQESLKEQNDRLHQQLEVVGTQIASLQSRSTSEEKDGSEATATSSGLDNLQQVIKYLRREKEIVDVQLELSSQESKRLKQQLNYTQSQLDDTRLLLNQQNKSEQEKERAAFDTRKLMNTINELNTFRESNVTLRNESRQAQSALAEKTREVEQLLSQIEPLQANIRELQDKNEGQAGENRLLQEDRDRWRQRTQDILQKYDRVDPAELEALQSQVQTLQKERDELQSTTRSLQEQVDASGTQIAQAHEQGREKAEDLKSRLTEQFKARSKTQSAAIKEKDASLQAVTKEMQDLEQRVTSLQADLDRAIAEKDQAVQSATTAGVNTVDATAPDGSEDGQVDENEPAKVNQTDVQNLQEQVNAAEARTTDENNRASALQGEIAAGKSKVSELEQRVQEVQQKLDAANIELEQLRNRTAQQDATTASNAVSEEAFDKLRSDLALAQQDADNLRAAASIQVPSVEASADEGGKSIADQLGDMREAIQAVLETRHNERVQKLEETFKQRSQTMREQLSKKLKDGKDQLRQENEAALQALRTSHEQEMESLRQRHREELDELRRQEETKFSDFKNSQSAESQPKEEAGDGSNKNEDQASNPAWTPTEAEVRSLVSSNAIVRGILRNNITTKVNEAKTALTSQLKDEHGKELAARLAEAQTKLESAVSMEGKKNALKINMLDNRSKIAQLKLDIISKAANETPSRPVSEVWELAKSAKPVSSTTGPSMASPKVQAPVQSGSTQQNTSVQQAVTAPPQGPAPSSTAFFGQPTVITPLQSSGTTAPNGQAPPSQPLSFAGNAVRQNPAPNGPSSNAPGPGAAQAPSNQPFRPQAQGPASMHPNAGTGPAALRGLQQSGLPVARGGPNSRGTRGRGQGQGAGRGGRGGPQSVNISSQQNQQQTAPSPTQLSGAAKQFVPQGNKRPRDEGEGGNQHGADSGNGKRIRGGGGGAQ